MRKVCWREERKEFVTCTKSNAPRARLVSSTPIVKQFLTLMQLQPVATLSSNYFVMQDAYSCIGRFEYTEVRTHKVYSAPALASLG
jgi:hypothetical protein